jgi:hypothetical protein
LEVWTALSEMQFHVNGVALLCAQRLTTSPTMNEALDGHIEASAAEDPFAEAAETKVEEGKEVVKEAGGEEVEREEQKAAEALLSRALSVTSGRSFSGRPAMPPLLSRSATLRESHTGERPT